MAEEGHSVEVEGLQMAEVAALVEDTQVGTPEALEEVVVEAAYLGVLASNSRRRAESYCSHGLPQEQTHLDMRNPWPFP